MKATLTFRTKITDEVAVIECDIPMPVVQGFEKVAGCPDIEFSITWRKKTISAYLVDMDVPDYIAHIEIAPGLPGSTRSKWQT